MWSNQGTCPLMLLSIHRRPCPFLLYIAILRLFAQVIAWDTEWRAVDRNRAEAVLLDCACFIVASLVLTLILRFLFSNVGGVLTSVNLVGTTMYLLMGFLIELL